IIGVATVGFSGCFANCESIETTKTVFVSTNLPEKTAYVLKTLVSGSSSGTGLSKTPCAATTYEVRDLDHTSPKSASGTFWRRTRSPNQDSRQKLLLCNLIFPEVGQICGANW
ncbi:unnamed protein product, partial [Acanthoscelides obtectus]